MAINLRRFTPERFLWSFAAFLLLVAIVAVRYCALNDKIEWISPVPAARPPLEAVQPNPAR